MIIIGAYVVAVIAVSYIIGKTLGVTAQLIAIPFFFLGGLWVGHIAARYDIRRRRP